MSRLDEDNPLTVARHDKHTDWVEYERDAAPQSRLEASDRAMLVMNRPGVDGELIYVRGRGLATGESAEYW